MSKPIEVPEHVVEALEAVRSEGRYNMLSATEVVRRMSDLGHAEAFLWLVDVPVYEAPPSVNKDRYMAGLEEMGERRKGSRS